MARCKKNCSSWWLNSVIALIAVLSIILCFITIVFVSTKDNKSSVLVLIRAGDIITHYLLQPSWLFTLWYSGVTLRSKPFPPSDESLNISVIPFNDANVFEKKSAFTGPYPNLFPMDDPGSDMYMFPLDYLSMPVPHLMEGSTVTVELSIQLPMKSDTLRSAIVYVFDFYQNMPTNPNKYNLDHFDVTNASVNNNTFTYHVRKSAYLFFYIIMSTSANSVLLYSNLKFEQRTNIFTKTPAENVLKKTILSEKSTFVEYGMFSPPRVYLYAHPVEGIEDVSWDHVEMQLKNRWWFQCVLMVGFFMIFFGFLFVFIMCLCCRYRRRHSYQYTQLQPVSNT